MVAFCRMAYFNFIAYGALRCSTRSIPLAKWHTRCEWVNATRLAVSGCPGNTQSYTAIPSNPLTCIAVVRVIRQQAVGFVCYTYGQNGAGATLRPEFPGILPPAGFGQGAEPT